MLYKENKANQKRKEQIYSPSDRDTHLSAAKVRVHRSRLRGAIAKETEWGRGGEKGVGKKWSKNAKQKEGKTKSNVFVAL